MQWHKYVANFIMHRHNAMFERRKERQQVVLDDEVERLFTAGHYALLAKAIRTTDVQTLDGQYGLEIEVMRERLDKVVDEMDDDDPRKRGLLVWLDPDTPPPMREDFQMQDGERLAIGSEHSPLLAELNAVYPGPRPGPEIIQIPELGEVVPVSNKYL